MGRHPKWWKMATGAVAGAALLMLVRSTHWSPMGPPAGWYLLLEVQKVVGVESMQYPLPGQMPEYFLSETHGEMWLTGIDRVERPLAVALYWELAGGLPIGGGVVLASCRRIVAGGNPIHVLCVRGNGSALLYCGGEFFWLMPGAAWGKRVSPAANGKGGSLRVYNRGLWPIRGLHFQSDEGG